MLDFETLKMIYENKIYTLRMKMNKHFLSDEEAKTTRIAIHYFFEDIKSYTAPYYVEYTQKDFTEEGWKMLCEKFIHDGEQPYRFIIYRDNIIPVYDDDYGQQDYTVIRGEVYGGGAYNFNAAEEFCSIMDYYLEKEFLAADPSSDWSKSDIDINEFLAHPVSSAE